MPQANACKRSADDTTIITRSPSQCSCQYAVGPRTVRKTLTGVCNRCDSQGGADRVVSDALSIAMLLGTALGVTMYAAAPWMLARIAGPASAAVVAPALVYVRIRCARAGSCIAVQAACGLSVSRVQLAAFIWVRH